MSWTLHEGDALTVLPTLTLTDPADAVMMDPPYNSGGRTNAARRGDTARGKYVSGDAQHDLLDFGGDSRDQRAYTYWLSQITAQCLRLARPGASLLVFTDWAQLPATSDALQAGGWTWRGIIPWRKPIARPQKDGFKRECEYVLWGSHGEPARHTPTVYLPGWLEGSQPRGRERVHITQKPVAVMQQLVRIAPEGGLILDPFTGSGTTGVAALMERRNFVGVEESPGIARAARGRLTDALSAASQKPLDQAVRTL
ncbi:DNA-methyltransferase [Actinacidiphila sp. ITFR-21]|uniref:DNA-methyltransferase n=1 Tax=Actinacidiphila sp. ITFR-21 TaxID=3075199 RepID=UPI0028894025|nr:site-specific DNA-methyltransferase [Streptomyces sp. ITFR-21]WNI16631.1 site-specific DNA-methyltransferase [Streptomyces sp. ITFR-21]